jgi:hypothetical protein
MGYYLLTGYVKKEKKKQHMAIFPLGGVVVYLTIARCIVCVNSDYINFNRV